MRKSIKTLITAFALCAVSAFAVVASGCNVKDKIEQTRCDHVMIDGKVTKEATCSEVGEKILECTMCTYTETEKIPKLAHTEIELKAVSPTCTKSGLTSGIKCGVCDEVLVVQTVVNPMGHNVVSDKAVPSTCTSTGLTEGSHCKRCTTVFQVQATTPMLEHTLIEVSSYAATCEDKGFTGGLKCKNCDYAIDGEVLPALGHSYDNGEITKEVTCTMDGEKTYTCATCNDSYVVKIPFLGHTYEDGNCQVCGQIESFEFSINNVTFVRNVEAAVASSVETLTWEEWVSFHCPIKGAMSYWDGNVVTGEGNHYILVPGSAIGVNPAIGYYVVCYENLAPVSPADKIVDGYNYRFSEMVLDTTDVMTLNYSYMVIKENPYRQDGVFNPVDFRENLLFVAGNEVYNHIRSYNGAIYYEYINEDGKVAKSTTAFDGSKWYAERKIYLWGCSTVNVSKTFYDWVNQYTSGNYKDSCRHI